jgi:hypothetical protein
MRRRLFTLLSALSLLLCVGACVMWARSYSPNRFAGLGYPPLFSDCRGEIIFTHSDRIGDSDPYSRGGMGFYLTDGRETLFFADGAMSSSNSFTRVYVPYWATIILFAALALISLRIRATDCQSFAEKVCFACGYDLRATPDRCPECGTVPIAPK